VHPEAVQHFGRGPESNCLALLLESQGRQKDRNETVPKGTPNSGCPVI